MEWLFSASAQRFFNVKSEANVLFPADCIPVSAALAQRVMDETQSGDRLLVVQADGLPSTVSRIVFSPSELMFFHAGINTPQSYPSDCLDVTVSLAEEIQDQLATGRLIAADDKGMPITVPRPPATEAELAQRALLERDARLAEAAIRIAPLQDAADLGDAGQQDEIKLQAWKRYRIALNRIERDPGFPRDIPWPERPDLPI
ncbi:tail fiber assembly protein [Achromobacter piechaudii]|uniref:Tail fiber assembly protein n=1 Tax=Achromobacter piechaudii TaxID=72556 RepID=A0A6S7DGX0_9BURK|nr:tail fiber assembly protein [Achromobacter piechaudii]CAB3890987.1 hypothetical protein LMG1861_03801 [Achromobacter piechaudii]